MLDFLDRLRKAIVADHLTVVAAGVAFYMFLSLFPATFAAVSVYGLVSDPHTADRHLERLEQVMPGPARDVVAEQLGEVTEDTPTTLGWGAVLALLIAVWSARKGARALIKGLNIAYDETEDRNFVKVQAVALLITVAFFVFIVVAFALIALFPAIIRELPLGAAAYYGAEVVKWLMLVGLVLVALATIYRYAPSKYPPEWRFVSPGAIGAAVVWLLASAGFSWFAANFGQFQETYGFLAGAVVLLLWLWISCLVILVGAEVNHELELRRGADPHGRDASTEAGADDRTKSQA